jgi:glycerol-3-phosphate cytidylyltransferase
MTNKRKTVITYGTFDLMHHGHINILKKAKALGDYLIVGVTSEQYDRERGKLNVEETLEQRMENVRLTGLADRVIVEHYEGQKISDIQKYKVDLFAIGSDWANKFDYLQEYCTVKYLPRTPNISSTQLRSSAHTILQIGILGAGRIANRFVVESKFVSGCNVVGVCSRRKEDAERFANRHELDYFTTSYDSLLDKCDAIYVATPHLTHYEMSRRALERGKHVICEKPIVLQSTELADLYHLADKKGLQLFEALKTAYAPAYLRLIEFAKSGSIGSIKSVEATFTKIVQGNLRELESMSAGGSVNELASYPLLAITQLLGMPKNISYHSYFSNNVDLYTIGNCFFDSSYACFKVGLGVKSEGQLIISGTKGYILVPAPWWLTQEFQVHFEDQKNNQKFFYKFDGDGLRYEIAEFISLIQQKQKESWKLKREITTNIVSIIESFHKRVQTGDVNIMH